MKDYYRIIGVAPVDSKEKIQEVYRNISKNYRGGIKAELKSYTEDKMKQIIAAYNVLNDDQKRKDYDAQPQFQVRKSSSKLVSVAKKKEEKDEKKPFRWGIPIMEIIMMPFRNPEAAQKDQTPEEKANMHFTLGISMSEDKTLLEQSKNEFMKALKFIPDFKEAEYNIGIMSYKMGSYSEALEHFKKVNSIDPRDLHAKKMIELLDEK